MSTLVWMIVAYFAASWAYSLGGNRNIDDVLPWLRIGKRWRAHHILPVVIFIPFVAWIEGWIFSETTWPNFGTHIPSFEVRDPGEVKIVSSVPPPLAKGEKLDPEYFLKRLARQRAKQMRQSAATRQLSAVLSAEDRASFIDLPPIQISSNAKRIDVFSVREEQTALDANIARGWFARLTTGYQPAQYQVTTKCGFDISAQPAERVCFSAIPAPIFLKGTKPGCIEGAPDPTAKRTELKDGFAITRQETLKCDYTINMPWILLRMDRDGVRAINCVFDSLRRETGPCDNGALVLSLPGAKTDGVIDWSQYMRTPEVVTVRLEPRPDMKGEATAVVQWSERHITRNHASIIPSLNPEPTPVERIENDVPLPASHFTAMRFLGVPVPASQNDRAASATTRIKNVIAIDHITTQIHASYPLTCRELIGARQSQLQIDVARQASTQSAPAPPIFSLRSSMEPRNVSIGGALCRDALPLLLADLY
jgi:hypothetical protein